MSREPAVADRLAAMSDERRYRDEEVSEIFALAATEGGASLPAPTEEDGLTLGELQAVGREVGLSPEKVAAAAAAIDARPEALPRQSLLGAPVSVGRVVDLPRAATDREWQFLVAELRETFDAKGELSTRGGVREWSNGNLHAVLEETEAGHRLRLATRKGNALEVAVSGGFMLLFGLALVIMILTAGKPEAAFLPVFFGLGGGGALAWNAYRLPKWAAERELQMEHIAARARELLSEPAEGEAPEISGD